MSSEGVVDRLAALEPLAGIPREQFQWLVDHGEVHQMEDGGKIRGDGALVGLFIMISGRFSVRVVGEGTEREVREVTAGGVTGFLPYSRMTTPRAHLVADGPVEFLHLRREDLPAMTRECYEFTASCVHEMLDRARVFKADDKRLERMAALGRLSAGLAHELNNPTAAVARAARELDGHRGELVAAARALGAAGLEGSAVRAFEALEAAARRAATEPLAPIARADLEDRVMEWLESRELDSGLADPLVDHGLTVEDLDAAATALDAGQLAVVLRYVAVSATARGLTADIAAAAARIHSLVQAVKKHTHMDRAPDIEPVVLTHHLADTMALMSSKAAAKGISLDLNAAADLPTVAGSVADLNQVWMHLVDNAIDAATTLVQITIDVDRDRDLVLVRVIDDGSGIPAADRERVFEPFFTTKDVGEGRGLGLDVVRTVVTDHRGLVELASRPGRTEFCVSLPVAQRD